MKSSRIAVGMFAAIIGLGTLVGSAQYSPVSATDWSWLGNKDYVACLQLFANGDFLMPKNATPAERAAKHEQGRHYCNRQYLGHD